jgi:hypothetical protein
VRRLAGWVRPGGRLVIQDVVTRPGLRHLPANAFGFAVRLLSGRRRATPLAALYDAHGRGERYLRPREAVRVYRELLPGARVVHHLEWRYTMVWDRPAS